MQIQITKKLHDDLWATEVDTLCNDSTAGKVALVSCIQRAEKSKGGWALVMRTDGPAHVYFKTSTLPNLIDIAASQSNTRYWNYLRGLR
jgi:ABC-type polar amino acid transport system ATPase subunit